MLRRAVRRIPRPVWAAVYPILSRFVAPDGYYEGTEYEDRNSAFSQIYEENRWHDGESKSGVGSTVAYTDVLRADLRRMLSRLSVKRFLDAPCGDFNWMRYLQLPDDCVYKGRDIVPKLIDDLRQEFPSIDWDVLDIVMDPIPEADVWMCRDVLFHLPIADCLGVLRNMAKSNVHYFLAKNFDFVRENRDVRPGGFRYINLRRPPFNLPAPIQRIADFHVPAPPAYLDLWSREQIARAI